MNVGAMPFPAGRKVAALVQDVLWDGDPSREGTLVAEGNQVIKLDIPPACQHLEITGIVRAMASGVNAGTLYMFWNGDRTHANYKIIGNQVETSNSLYHDNWPFYGRVNGTDSPLASDSTVFRIFVPGCNLSGFVKHAWSFSAKRWSTAHSGTGLALYDFCVFWQGAMGSQPIQHIEIGLWGVNFAPGSNIQITGYRLAEIALVE